MRLVSNEPEFFMTIHEISNRLTDPVYGDAGVGVALGVGFR
jgi:hypothetical protein